MADKKYTKEQQRALDTVKKALAAHKEKPTELTQKVVVKHYDGMLRQTLDASHLDKAEAEALAALHE